MVTKEHRHLVKMRDMHPANTIRTREVLSAALDEVDRLKAGIAGRYAPLREDVVRMKNQRDEWKNKHDEMYAECLAAKSEILSLKSSIRSMEMDTVPLMTLETLNNEMIATISKIAKTDTKFVRRALSATCQAIINSRKTPLIIETPAKQEEPQASEKT